MKRARSVYNVFESMKASIQGTKASLNPSLMSTVAISKGADFGIKA